ncbi:MAG: PorT family protein [Sphingobacteriales bacterium]|nr:MAG: PorT family protein [Sphingobacteriales bacterium]
MKMRTFLFSILFLLGFSSLVNAQNIRLGLCVTPGFSWMKFNDGQGFTQTDNKFGVNYGLVVDIGFAERYALSTGIFAEHGGANTQTILGEVNTNLVYVNIPLTLKLKTNQFGKFTPYGQVGFTPGVAVQRKVDNIKANDEFSIFNVSLTVNAGTEFEISEGTSFFAAFHIDNGLMNVAKDSGDVTLRKSFAGLRAGVLF